MLSGEGNTTSSSVGDFFKCCSYSLTTSLILFLVSSGKNIISLNWFVVKNNIVTESLVMIMRQLKSDSKVDTDINLIKA